MLPPTVTDKMYYDSVLKTFIVQSAPPLTINSFRDQSEHKILSSCPFKSYSDVFPLLKTYVRCPQDCSHIVKSKTALI